MVTDIFPFQPCWTGVVFFFRFTVVHSAKAIWVYYFLLLALPVFLFTFLWRYLGNHGESKQVADAADDSDEDLSAVTLP